MGGGGTAGVMVTGEVAGGGDGCQRLKLKFQTKNIALTHIFSSGVMPQKDTPVTARQVPAGTSDSGRNSHLMSSGSTERPL